MKISKRNIAIVCGGDSSEHDVSMRSAQGLYSFFDKERYNVYIVDVKGLDWSVNLSDGSAVKIDKNDFSFKLDGKTFDKFALNNYLRGYGINVADSLLLRRGEENKYTEEEIEKRIGMPCFVKPAADGSSFGVSKVKNADQIAPALRNAFMECEEVMIESYLDGTEVTVGCYKTKEKSVVFPVTEVVTSNEFFDYDAKYNGQVQEITPARIPQELSDALRAETSRIYDILHCNGIIRVDYIITKNADGSDKINMLEINTTPGMTATSFIPQQVRAAGLDIKDVLSEIVENQF